MGVVMLLCMRTFHSIFDNFSLLNRPQGDAQKGLEGGPFQDLWNRLIGHHYIKVILLDRRMRALSSDAGNH